MKRSGLPKVVALALSTGMALSACGFFSVEDAVGMKAVPVELAFGVPSPESAPTFDQPDFDFGPAPVPPQPVLPPNPTPPPEDRCPPTSAISVRDPIVPHPTLANEPNEQEFDAAFKSQIDGQEPKAGITERVIHDVEREQSPFSSQGSPNGHQFFVRDGFSGMEFQLLSFEGQAEEQDSETAEGGLYLKRVVIPTGDVSDPDTERLSFITTGYPYLKILDYPITQGTELTSTANDVSLKRTSIQNPITGEEIEVPSSEILPSPNSMRTRSVAGSIDNQVQVCAELGAAYRVSLDLRITGAYNHRVIGTFWLSPQYGGWPIKDDYFMFGDLLDGVFSNNIMQLPDAD